MSEGRLVLSPAQRGTGNEKVKLIIEPLLLYFSIRSKLTRMTVKGIDLNWYFLIGS